MAGPEPLTVDEVGRLVAWRRQMRIGLGVSVGLLVAWVALISAAGDQPWIQPLGGVFGLAIVVFGVVVQFGGRCPRCGTRLAPRVPLEIPKRCPRCSVELAPRV